MSNFISHFAGYVMFISDGIKVKVDQPLQCEH